MTGRGLCWAALALATTLYAQDTSWPGFRGPRRDGVSRGGTPPSAWSAESNVRWKTDLPGPGSSSPIVVGDLVIVACYSGYGAYLDDGGDPAKLVHHLLAFHRVSGASVWRLDVAGPLPGAARKVQLNEHGFASPTPECDGQTIYWYLGRAGVAAVDLAGKLLWQTDLGSTAPDLPAATNAVEMQGKRIPLRWGSASSPLLVGDLVIVNASEECDAIVALDRRTGKVVWRKDSLDLEGTSSSPALAGSADSAVVLVNLGGDIWALAPKTGALVWRVPTTSRGGIAPTPICDDSIAYVFGGDEEGYAIRWTDDPEHPTASRVLWKGPNLDIGSPVRHGDHLFLVRTNGTASCVAVADGKEVFSGRLEGRTGSVYASPVLADGRLYVVSRRQGTFVYAANEKLTLISKNAPLDGSQFNASPAVVGPWLYLRSDAALYGIAEAPGATPR